MVNVVIWILLKHELLLAKSMMILISPAGISQIHLLAFDIWRGSNLFCLVLYSDVQIQIKDRNVAQKEDFLYHIRIQISL